MFNGSCTAGRFGRIDRGVLICRCGKVFAALELIPSRQKRVIGLECVWEHFCVSFHIPIESTTPKLRFCAAAGELYEAEVCVIIGKNHFRKETSVKSWLGIALCVD